MCRGFHQTLFPALPNSSNLKHHKGITNQIPCDSKIFKGGVGVASSFPPFVKMACTIHNSAL